MSYDYDYDTGRAATESAIGATYDDEYGECVFVSSEGVSLTGQEALLAHICDVQGMFFNHSSDAYNAFVDVCAVSSFV